MKQKNIIYSDLLKKVVINLTPHDFNLYVKEECVESHYSQGSIRAEEEIIEKVFVGDVPLSFKKYIAPELPRFDPTKEILVVSQIVLQALAESGSCTAGIICPDTGQESVVRNMGGRIIGVRGVQGVRNG